MPEAPEVQTVLDDLKRQLAGLAIVSASITHPKLSAAMPYEQMEKDVSGQKFEGFHRLGKYLIFVLSDYDLVCHLRMEGKFLILDEMPQDPKVTKHIHAVFKLSNGKLLCYQDTRKFGRMYLYPRTEDWQSLPVFKNVGLDVMDPSLTGQMLCEKAAKRCLPIKSFLLDQKMMAGIGNIYADEILFASRIHPLTSSCALDLNQWQTLLDAARKILASAHEHGGTTIRSFSSQNHAGSYQQQLMVHQRKDMPCFECGEAIESCKIGGRTTYWCPSCQKAGLQEQQQLDEIRQQELLEQQQKEQRKKQKTAERRQAVKQKQAAQKPEQDQ